MMTLAQHFRRWPLPVQERSSFGQVRDNNRQPASYSHSGAIEQGECDAMLQRLPGWDEVREIGSVIYICGSNANEVRSMHVHHEGKTPREQGARTKQHGTTHFQA
jgi:hypothetical protein